MLGNITITAEGPNQQSATGQVPYLAAALATHPDALIIHPADPQALLGSLQPYFSAKIPVITTLSTIDGNGVTASWVGNYTAEGQAAALAAGKLMGGRDLLARRHRVSAAYDVSETRCGRRRPSKRYERRPH